MRLILFGLFAILFLIQVSAQEKPVQTLRGIAVDKSIKAPLSGATIEIVGDPNRIKIANKDGNFSFSLLPVGRYQIKISYVGYKSISIPNIEVESGKETYLQIEMEEDVDIHKEVIVQSKHNLLVL